MNELDRRTVLRAGGAVLGGSVIAGCSDDTDSGDDGTEDGGEQNETDDQSQPDNTDSENSTEASLSIRNVTFLDGRPRGYRDFDTAPGQTYAVTDPIHIYFEPTGFGTEEADGGDLAVDMITSLTITGSGGTEVYSNTDVLRRTLAEDQLDEYFAFWGAALSPETEPGEYTATVTVEDQISGQTVETTATFTLEAAENSSYAQEFLDTIRSELEITVTGFAERNVADLRYASTYEISTESSRDQIGYIAGAYAGVVDQGWTAERLVGTVTDANDDRYRFEVDSESAQAYIDEETTAEEFATEVLDSLTEI